MNLDFHYYGTYYAARLAGFKEPDAAKIAYYAQFVDECTKSRLEKKVKSTELGGAKLLPTVQSNTEIATIAGNPAPFREEDRKEVAVIWSCFHFLPGNIQDDIKYGGPQSDKGKIDSWEYDDTARKEFKLLCLPNSQLVVEMVEKLRVEYQQAAGRGRMHEELEHIGMIMHVLADTWAHCWFAGIPAWFINEVKEDVYEVVQTEESEKKNKLWYVYDILFNDSIEHHKYSCVPEAPRYNGVFNLGHGRLGHIPDYSFMNYEYAPKWESKQNLPRKKSNPRFFMFAFRQMVYAMKCVLENTEFEAERYADLDEPTRMSLETIFQTRKIDTSEEWRKMLGGKCKSPLASFNADESFRIYVSAGDKKATSLHRFLKAAAEHVELVKSHHLF